MRCSLLVLSSYMDSELAAERAGELEAHLVGCNRCSTALGYLREEAQRINGLPGVHVDEPQADQLLALIGLHNSDDDTRPPNGTWQHDANGVGAPVWPDDAGGGRALPWTPRDAGPPDPEPPAPPPLEPFIAASVPVAPDAGPIPQPVVAPEVEPGPEPPAPPEVTGALPYAPAPPLTAHVYREPGGLSRFAHRARDAVALRLALRRSAPHDLDDDSVQVISGTGAPSWAGKPADRGYVQRMERRRGGAITPSAVGANLVADDDDDEIEARGRHVPGAYPASVPEVAEPAVAASAVRPESAPPSTAGWVPAAPVAPAEPAPVAPPRDALDHNSDDDLAIPQRPAPTPGRHMRSVARTAEPSSAQRFAGFGQLSNAVVHRTGARRGPGVGVVGVDRRLWAFGAGTAVLLIVGLLVGRAATPMATGSPTTHPSAAASAAPIRATATPTAASTPTPTPAGGPAQLTSPISLGSGGNGFSVAGIRYGLHGPKDYRLVFDITPGSRSQGSPTVLMGFGTPTTFYVEFTGASAAGPPETPEKGGVVTGIQLLTPSPIPGRTIYEFTLTRNANFIANYLDGPRLVIDLS